MSGNVHCPHCNGQLLNSPELAGQVTQCPYCQGQFQMPQAAPIPQARPAMHGYPPQHQPLNVTTNVSVNSNVQTNTFGVISVCLAVLGLFTCGLTCIPGVICAIIGLPQQPNGTAIVGLIFNGIVAIPMVGFFSLGAFANAVEGTNADPALVLGLLIAVAVIGSIAVFVIVSSQNNSRGRHNRYRK